MILAPLGLWLAGVTLDHYGFTITMGWAAGALIIALAVSLASPALRAMPQTRRFATPRSRRRLKAKPPDKFWWVVTG